MIAIGVVLWPYKLYILTSKSNETQVGYDSDQVAMDDYYDFEIVNTISTADWILLLLIISFWLFLEKNIYN